MPKSAPSKKSTKASKRAEWSIADAKARLSELVAKTSNGAQTITRNGKPVAVVVALEEWQRKTAQKGSLLELFQSSPLWGADLDMTREKVGPREIDL